MNSKNFMKNRKGGCLFSLVKLAVCLFVVVAIALYFFTSQIISRSIKTVGDMAGVEMRGNANLVWGECAFSLSNFHIENPEGFLKGDAIRFDEVYINPDPTIKSIKGEEAFEIKEIRISGPFLRLEQQGITKNNLLELKNKFSDLSSKLKSEEAKPVVKDEKKSDAPARKFKIKKVVFENGEVAFTAGTMHLEAPLMSFTLENLGGENGATFAEISAEVVIALIPRAIDSAKDFALKSGSTKEFLESIKMDSGEAIDKARSAVESIFNLKKSSDK